MDGEELEDAVTEPVGQDPAGARQIRQEEPQAYGDVLVADHVVVQESGTSRTSLPLGEISSIEQDADRTDWVGIAALVLSGFATWAVYEMVSSPSEAKLMTSGALVVLSFTLLFIWLASSRSTVAIKTPTASIIVDTKRYGGYDTGRLVADVERRIKRLDR